MKRMCWILALFVCLGLIFPAVNAADALQDAVCGGGQVLFFKGGGDPQGAYHFGGDARDLEDGGKGVFAPWICLNIPQADVGRSGRSGAGRGIKHAQAEKETGGPEEIPVSISDPLEPINRAFYHFNDKLYFWLLKPVARVYRAAVPETARVCVKNFFYNVGFPVRFVNCVFQGKFQGACHEFTSFMANTTAGFGGLIDVATNNMKINRHEEDLGQTFGFYGMGPGIYINWPVLGPSSLRDTFGGIGDCFLDPFIFASIKYRLSVKSFDTVNRTSLTLGDYEDLKKAALDPYVALRDAYDQNRQSKIAE